jgi:chromosome segregation ATPase
MLSHRASLVPSEGMLQFQDLQNEMSSFLSRFDTWTQQYRTRIQDTRTDHLRQLAQVSQRTETVERQIHAVTEECEKLVMSMDEETERVEECEKAVEQSKFHLESMETVFRTVSGEAEQWRLRLNQLQSGT